MNGWCEPKSSLLSIDTLPPNFRFSLSLSHSQLWFLSFPTFVSLSFSPLSQSHPYPVHSLEQLEITQAERVERTGNRKVKQKLLAWLTHSASFPFHVGFERKKFPVQLPQHLLAMGLVNLGIILLAIGLVNLGIIEPKWSIAKIKFVIGDKIWKNIKCLKKYIENIKTHLCNHGDFHDTMLVIVIRTLWKSYKPFLYQ